MLHTILNVLNFNYKYTKMRSGDNAVNALLLSLNTLSNTITLYILWFCFLFWNNQRQENSTGTVQLRQVAISWNLISIQLIIFQEAKFLSC